MARLYKNMDIYKIGYNLTLDIHKLLDKFPESQNRNIVDQMRRAVTSIPLNIAEGSVRKTERAFLQYLNYSYGSAKEVEVLLNLSYDLGYISEAEFNKLNVKLDSLMAKLFGFMKNIEKRFEKNKRFFTGYNKN